MKPRNCLIFAVLIVFPFQAQSQVQKLGSKEKADQQRALNLLRKASEQVVDYNGFGCPGNRPITQFELSCAVIMLWEWLKGIESMANSYQSFDKSFWLKMTGATYGAIDFSKLEEEAQWYQNKSKKLAAAFGYLDLVRKSYKPGVTFSEYDKEKKWKKFEADMIRREKQQGKLKK